MEYLQSDGGTKVPRFPGLQCLALTSDLRLLYSDNFAHWFESDTEYAAIGSGMQFAMAAMSEGKSPIEACKVAAKLDPSTGMGYKKYEF